MHRSMTGRPERVGATWLRGALLGIVVTAVILLTALRVAGAAGVMEAGLQVMLVAGFAVLALIDYRWALGIAVLELACGGASGHWTVIAGGISGRIALDAIVIAAGGLMLAREAGAGRLRLGRYTRHAVSVAVMLSVGWMALGLADGNAPGDVFGDGNSYLFLVFAIAIAAAAQLGDLAWLRRWVLVACAANAAVTGALAIAALGGVVTIDALHEALVGRLDVGGAILMMPDGAFRLYLASGVYLVVGVALVTWELLREPRRLWPWLLYGLLGFAVVASWTRGYWLAACLAAMAVLVLGARRPGRPVGVVAVTVGLFLVVTLFGTFAGFSLPRYLADRASSTFAIGEDSPGAGSNSVKLRQARVLVQHIAERPALGWGFGAIAPDYADGRSYRYELTYLDVAYKTGILGLVLFLSLPVRLLPDAARGRLGTRPLARDVSPRQAAVPLAILISILALGATNPYLLAAFGIAPILLSIAWIDPFDHPPVRRVIPVGDGSPASVTHGAARLKGDQR